MGRRARKGPKQHLFFLLLPITTVNEHWALLPASARDAYPVSSRGTGITVLTYQLESLAFLVWNCDYFFVLKSAGKTQVPENG